jgi:hypothetical protein
MITNFKIFEKRMIYKIGDYVKRKGLDHIFIIIHIFYNDSQYELINIKDNSIYGVVKQDQNLMLLYINLIFRKVFSFLFPQEFQVSYLFLAFRLF